MLKSIACSTISGETYYFLSMFVSQSASISLCQVSKLDNGLRVFRFGMSFSWLQTVVDYWRGCMLKISILTNVCIGRHALYSVGLELLKLVRNHMRLMGHCWCSSPHVTENFTVVTFPSDKRVREHQWIQLKKMLGIGGGNQAHEAEFLIYWPQV